MVSLGLAPVLLTVAESRPAPPGARRVAVGRAGGGADRLLLVSVAGGEASTGPAPVAGVLLAIASGTTYALTTAAGGSDQPYDVAAGAHQRDDARRGRGRCCPASAFVDGPRVTTDPAALAWLLYLGALTMALAYVLLYSGLRVVAPSTAVTASLVEPVTAAVVAAVVLESRSARSRSSGSSWSSARSRGSAVRAPRREAGAAGPASWPVSLRETQRTSAPRTLRAESSPVDMQPRQHLRAPPSGGGMRHGSARRRAVRRHLRGGPVRVAASGRSRRSGLQYAATRAGVAGLS